MKNKNKLQKNKTIAYAVISLFIIIILGICIFALKKSPPQLTGGECRANNFTDIQLQTINKNIDEIKNFCKDTIDITSCKNKVYYIYTEEQNMSDNDRTWLYLNNPENISGMKPWSILNKICIWIS